MFQYLMNNPIAWGILSIITIVSLVYAIICQQKNKERKELSFAKKSNVLVHNQKSKFEKLSLFYDNTKIDNLCVSKIAIWNSGNRVLQSSDIVTENELKLYVGIYNEILETSIITETETSNKFDINMLDKNTIKVTFDYVETNDGIVVQIIHTGIKDDVKLSCKIKGGKPLKQYIKDEKIFKVIKVLRMNFIEKINLFSSILIGMTYFFMGCFMIFAGIWKKIHPEDISLRMLDATNASNNEGANVAIVCGIVILFGSLFIISSMVKILYIGMPSKLRKYYVNNEDE